MLPAIPEITAVSLQISGKKEENVIRRFLIVAMIFYFEKIKNIKKYPHIISELWISFSTFPVLFILDFKNL